MNIGDFQTSAVQRQQRLAVKTPSGNPPEESTATSLGPGDSFSPLEIQNPGLIEKKTHEASSKSLAAWGRTAAQSALHLVSDLIPGAIGKGLAALKDTFSVVRDSHFEHKVDSGTEAEASKTLQQAKERLLNPNDWKSLGPGFAAASFQVYSHDSKKPLDGIPKSGDYLKIGLPDPFPYAWVRIESITSDDKGAEVVVRPSLDPTSDSENIAHFFSDQTINVFRVSQEGSQVVSSVTTVGEKLNTSTGILGKAVAFGRLAGARLGAKKPQWDAFTRKLLEGPSRAKALRATGLNTALEISGAALSAGSGSK
jgi:hypothetical protein